HRLRLLTFPMRTAADKHTLAAAECGTSRFPLRELLRMPGSSTTPSRAHARISASAHVAFRAVHGVGARVEVTFAAQWLACALPYRRFVPALADRHARLGVDVVRYSFIVVDSHHLLPAGLPAHGQFTFSAERRRRFNVGTGRKKQTAPGLTVYFLSS